MQLKTKSKTVLRRCPRCGKFMLYIKNEGWHCFHCDWPVDYY